MVATEPHQNELLAALPKNELEFLVRDLERVDLRAHQVLYEPGQRRNWAYFPTNSVVTKRYVMSTGATGATALVGIEGVLGFSLYTGAGSQPAQVVVQIAGSAWRVRNDVLRQAFEAGDSLHQMMLRYTEALVVQIGQTAVCNRYHTVEQRLCRWLLMIADRLPSDHIAITQDSISRILGVRREGVTEAASRLQRGDIIRYHRGRIEVVDRPRMEALACECYASTHHALARLTPWSACTRRARARYAAALSPRRGPQLAPKARSAVGDK